MLHQLFDAAELDFFLRDSGQIFPRQSKGSDLFMFLSALLTVANISLEMESTGFQHSTEVAKSLFKMIFFIYKIRLKVDNIVRCSHKGKESLTCVVDDLVPAVTLPGCVSDVFSGLKIFVS